ncbi:MAG: TlpA family protein disulfide reductase [Ilumatobacteraceae bacterium]
MADVVTDDAAADQPEGGEPHDAPRRRVAPFIVLGVLVVMVALFFVLATGNSGPDDKVGLVDSPLLGKPAPAVRSETLDGTPFDLARRKGSWVVVNFFNSTCAPCRAEHPELVTFAEQQATVQDGAELYTMLQINDDVDAVKRFFLTRGGNWPIVRDDEGTTNVAFGVALVPETFIIDPNGVVVVRWAGQIDADTLARLVQQQRDLYALS